MGDGGTGLARRRDARVGGRREFGDQLRRAAKGSSLPSFHFEAAVGDVLKQGVYDRALEWAERGRPALRTPMCTVEDGRFEIKEFALGARSATLEVGAVRSTLQGFNYGGRTRLDITGQPGEGDPEPPVFGAFTPPDSRFAVHGRNGAAGFYVAGRGGGLTGSFRTAHDAPLTPGRYTGAKNDMHLAGPQPEPGMSISTLWGYGDPCSSATREFTVNELVRHPDDGTTKSMEIAFEHRCTSPPGILVAGTISFRVGDTTPLAPWMSCGPAGTPSPARGPAATGGQAAAWRCTGPIGVRGSRRANRLDGTRRADRILAGRGDDRIRAGRGNDCVAGGAGRDRIAGGAGADILLGGAGRDVLVGGPGRDRLDCGPGRDTAYVGRGDRTRRCERVR